jgi:hypothetical protein
MEILLLMLIKTMKTKRYIFICLLRYITYVCNRTRKNQVTNDGLSGWWASSASGEAEIGSQIDLTFSELAVLSFEYGKL